MIPMTQYSLLNFIFCYTEGNSSCINSDDGDMRYMMYIWGFLVRVISSTYQSHEFKVWACTTSLSTLVFIALLDASDHACVCLCSRHDFQHMPFK